MSNTVFYIDIHQREQLELNNCPLFPYKFIYPTTLIYLVVFFFKNLLKTNESFGLYLSAKKLYFNVIEIPFVMKQLAIITGKITTENNVVMKTLQLDKSWSSGRPMKEFPQKEQSCRISLDRPTHPENDAHGTTNSYPGSSHPKSARTTDNIAVRAGLDLQSERLLIYVAPLPLVAQPYWCNIEPIFNRYGILRIYWPRYNDCILTSCQYRKVVYSRYLAN